MDWPARYASSQLCATNASKAQQLLDRDKWVCGEGGHLGRAPVQCSGVGPSGLGPSVLDLAQRASFKNMWEGVGGELCRRQPGTVLVCGEALLSLWMVRH